MMVAAVDKWVEVSREDPHAYHKPGIVATQRTPLSSRSGNCVGMIFTHWKQVHRPSERAVGLFEVLARQAADPVERKQAGEAWRENERRFRSLVTATWDYWLQNERRLDADALRGTGAHASGKDIGLRTIQDQVKRLGGRIESESGPGRAPKHSFAYRFCRATGRPCPGKPAREWCEPYKTHRRASFQRYGSPSRPREAAYRMRVAVLLVPVLSSRFWRCVSTVRRLVKSISPIW